MSIESLYQLFLESSGAATDTRNLPTDALFFALRGDRFNGNAYAKQALDAGAKAAVIDDPDYYNAADNRYILVENALKTLQRLARFRRLQLKNTRFFAITGSNGKTTTKELLRAALSTQFKVFATPGNMNNHIGLPLSILQIPPLTEIAILEMGDNHPGEIAELCAIAAPDFGLITNIGIDHIGHYADLQANADTKLELFDDLKTRDTAAFVNLGDDYISRYDFSGLKTYPYNGSAPNETPFLLGEMVETENGLEQIIFISNGERDEVFQTPLPGRHNAENVAAVVGVARYFGVNYENLYEAIKNYSPTNNRSQWVNKGGKRILLDAYNANPSSMEAAIQTVFEMEPRFTGLVLGDMLELGDETERYHRELGRYINQYNPVCVVAVGEAAKVLVEEIKVCRVHWAPNVMEAAEGFADNVVLAKTLLFKGSRGVALEKLLTSLPA